MFIPKNSIIFTATWAIHHNPAEFPDPDTFNPDRYLAFPKLASEYAGSPDFANRDKCPPPLEKGPR
jgi:cytochrome P450